ncbi:MAG TPA: hypothetical protein DCF33_00855 [Saprospirales bacterium]|nr:hypothetical protein [Saprospirales bacterium]
MGKRDNNDLGAKAVRLSVFLLVFRSAVVVGEDANNGTKHWLSIIFSKNLALLSAVGEDANSYGGAKFLGKLRSNQG